MLELDGGEFDVAGLDRVVVEVDGVREDEPEEREPEEREPEERDPKEPPLERPPLRAAITASGSQVWDDRL